MAWWPVRNRRRELSLRDGFLVVVLFWLVLGLVGSVPFLFSTQPVMNLTDSVFESMSGLTTTGTTVITGFDTQSPVKIGKKALPDRVVDSVWIFCELQSGVQCNAADFDGYRVGSGTAFSAVAACMNNPGPGPGAVGFHYADINDIAKWVLCVAMLLGRLEIFTLLVLSSPAFWRR